MNILNTVHTEDQRQAFLDDVDKYGREYAEAKHGYDRSNTNKAGVIIHDCLCSMVRAIGSVNDNRSK